MRTAPNRARSARMRVDQRPQRRQPDAAGDDRRRRGRRRRVDRPAAAQRTAQPELVRAERQAGDGGVAGPTARIVSSRPSGRIARDGDGRHGEGRQRDHHELAGLRGQDGRIVQVEAERSYVSTVSRRGRDGGHARAWPASTGRRSGAGAGRSAGRARPEMRMRGSARRPAMAVSSSRTSMPTGHQAMQRPQPTQPDDPELVAPRRRTCGSATGGSGPRSCGRKLPPATRREAER